MAERKNPQLDAEHQAILRKMMLLPENKTCADCKGHSPRWASTNLGIFICITCSGIHRKLGTHISQVRSITLDTWTPSQIQHFRKFGNAKASHYFEACLPPDFRRPHSSDSMQMERFIRDKYENKRYITIENGGLGGQTVSRNRSSRLAARPNPGSLGPRPTQPMSASRQAAYDSAPTVRKTGTSSMSYGGRFSRPVKPMRGSQQTPTTRNSFTPNTGGTSAIGRASTLKQLLTMGFPQDVAVKAIEVGDGDLQRSLDWVLLQDGKSMNQAQSAAPPRRVQKDLLDFDEPSAPNTTATVTPQQSAPKIMATESLISSTAKGTSTEPTPTPLTNRGFADFANFGDFQRTLPSAVPSKEHSTSLNPHPSSTPKNAPLTSSLDNLYRKSPPKPTTTPPHISPFSKAMSSLQFPKSSLETVGETGTANTHKNEDSLGLTTFESLSPQNLRLSGKAVPSMRLTGQQAGVQVPLTFASANEPPPPPPPSEHMLFPGTPDNQPPPPSPKLESVAKQTSSVQGHGESPEQVQSANSGTTAETREEAPKNDSSEKEDEQEKEEEEEVDPFAALSMMALSSATSAQKKKKDKKASSLKALEPNSSKGAEVVQSSINLDELLS